MRGRVFNNGFDHPPVPLPARKGDEISFGPEYRDIPPAWFDPSTCSGQASSPEAEAPSLGVPLFRKLIKRPTYGHQAKAPRPRAVGLGVLVKWYPPPVEELAPEGYYEEGEGKANEEGIGCEHPGHTVVRACRTSYKPTLFAWPFESNHNT